MKKIQDLAVPCAATRAGSVATISCPRRPEAAWSPPPPLKYKTPPPPPPPPLPPPLSPPLISPPPLKKTAFPIHLSCFRLSNQEKILLNTPMTTIHPKLIFPHRLSLQCNQQKEKVSVCSQPNIYL